MHNQPTNTHNDDLPSLWTSHDVWMTAFMLLNDATIHHVAIEPGKTTWFLAHTRGGGCRELARRFRLERHTLTVPLEHFHECYRDALAALAEAKEQAAEGQVAA